MYYEVVTTHRSSCDYFMILLLSSRDTDKINEHKFNQMA